MSDPVKVSGASPRKWLRWEITGILIIKFAIIVLAAFTIFGASQRLHVDMNVMSNQIFGNRL